MNREKPSIGDTVIHFKHEIETDEPKVKFTYRITGFAMHTETEETLVIYRSCWTGDYYARPIDMFMSEVDREKYPNVEPKYRFEKVDAV